MATSRPLLAGRGHHAGAGALVVSGLLPASRAATGLPSLATPASSRAWMQSLHLRRSRLCTQMPPPLHNLQTVRTRLWGQIEPPLHSLQQLRTRLCGQICEPPHSLQVDFCRWRDRNMRSATRTQPAARKHDACKTGLPCARTRRRRRSLCRRHGVSRDRKWSRPPPSHWPACTPCSWS